MYFTDRSAMNLIPMGPNFFVTGHFSLAIKSSGANFSQIYQAVANLCQKSGIINFSVFFHKSRVLS